MTTPLRGKALIAMPQLKDPFFEQAVCYVCQHDEEGTLGFIINKPVDMLEKDLLLDQHFSVDEARFQRPLLKGGPIHTDRGFVIHTDSGNWRNTLQISENCYVTTSQDILEAIVSGEFKKQYLIVLGYASWEPGQLETELMENTWLTSEPDLELLFTMPFEERWMSAIQRMGIQNIANLMSIEGHA